MRPLVDTSGWRLPYWQVNTRVWLCWRHYLKRYWKHPHLPTDYLTGFWCADCREEISEKYS